MPGSVGRDCNHSAVADNSPFSLNKLIAKMTTSVTSYHYGKGSSLKEYYSLFVTLLGGGNQVDKESASKKRLLIVASDL